MDPSSASRTMFTRSKWNSVVLVASGYECNVHHPYRLQNVMLIYKSVLGGGDFLFFL